MKRYRFVPVFFIADFAANCYREDFSCGGVLSFLVQKKIIQNISKKLLQELKFCVRMLITGRNFHSCYQHFAERR